MWLNRDTKRAGDTCDDLALICVLAPFLMKSSKRTLSPCCAAQNKSCEKTIDASIKADEGPTDRGRRGTFFL